MPQPQQQRVTMYRGKRLEDMTREELINAVIVLGRMLETAWEASRQLSDLAKMLNSRRR
jgi:hypothetical protein